MAVVEFPVRGRALARLCLDGRDRRAQIYAEIYRIDGTIRSLRETRAALLAEYRQEIRRLAEAGLVLLFASSFLAGIPI